jgi:hypothetical protein
MFLAIRLAYSSMLSFVRGIIQSIKFNLYSLKFRRSKTFEFAPNPLIKYMFFVGFIVELFS